MKKGKYMDALLSLPLNYSLFIDMEKNKPINVALDDIRYKPEIINNLEYRFINDDLGMVISFIQWEVNYSRSGNPIVPKKDG